MFTYPCPLPQYQQSGWEGGNGYPISPITPDPTPLPARSGVHHMDSSGASNNSISLPAGLPEGQGVECTQTSHSDKLLAAHDGNLERAKLLEDKIHEIVHSCRECRATENLETGPNSVFQSIREYVLRKEQLFPGIRPDFPLWKQPYAESFDSI
jgi:hypothetical protein